MLRQCDGEPDISCEQLNFRTAAVVRTEYLLLLGPVNPVVSNREQWSCWWPRTISVASEEVHSEDWLPSPVKGHSRVRQKRVYKSGGTRESIYS